MSEKNTQADIKYIFILFILALIVIIFGIIIYLLSDTVEEVSSEQIQTFSEEVIDAQNAGTNGALIVPDNIDELAEQEAEKAKAEDEKEEAEKKEIETIIESNTIKQTPENFNPRLYNARSETDAKLYGAELIQAYFTYIRSEEYEKACSLLGKSICSTTSNVASFSYYPRQTEDGFDVKRIYKAPIQKDDVAIYCVEYSYTLTADLNPEPITELFQYRISTRPDGLHEISARVCEEKDKWWRIVACPIRTPKKYCISQ